MSLNFMYGLACADESAARALMMSNMKYILAFTLFLALSLSASSCVAVGYSSGGGWFVWPGGLGLLLVIIVIFLLVRRRR